MKLLVLGGSKAQTQCIIKAQNMGHQVVICDYLKDAPGHQLADRSFLASTFDLEAVLQVAIEEQVDGIMTMGTDQPVYTGAYVANQLGLPMLNSLETALGVTNKKVMKDTFVSANIPTVDYRFVTKNSDPKTMNLKEPLVMKPIDSQGQRGIFYLESSEKIREKIDKTLSYSRSDVALVESYYEHDEVTFSGWVQDSQLYPLLLSDRVTFHKKEQLGICLSHEWPSKYLNEYGQDIVTLSEQIVKSFNIQEGPVYFQFLVGADGVKVNEIAARIGGAYEGFTIPEVTGFDIVQAQIKAQLGYTYSIESLEHYDIFNVKKHLSVQLFFVEPCDIYSMMTEEQMMALEGVMEVGFNVKNGDSLSEIENATARGGYIIITATNRKTLEEYINNLYNTFKIYDKEGNNRLIHTDYKTYHQRYFEKN